MWGNLLINLEKSFKGRVKTGISLGTKMTLEIQYYTFVSPTHWNKAPLERLAELYPEISCRNGKVLWVLQWYFTLFPLAKKSHRVIETGLFKIKQESNLNLILICSF